MNRLLFAVLYGCRPHRWQTELMQKGDIRDNWWVSLITFGEGYHNYHHAFPRDYRNGLKWYNVDPSKWVIYGLTLMGLSRNLVRSGPRHMRQSVA